MVYLGARVPTSLEDRAYGEYAYDCRWLRLTFVGQDMYDGQVLFATKYEVKYHPDLEMGKVYLIDYGLSKRLSQPPGQQPAIDLPETLYKHPLGMKRFDPYSWDVYCTGAMFTYIVEASTKCSVCTHSID